MCGIAGIVNNRQERIDPDLLFRMSDSLSHRGPDDERFVLFDGIGKQSSLFDRKTGAAGAGSIGFAHRRLSIIDLSSQASQPMSDETGRYWIVHNGEIFNYIEVREELEGRGYSFFSQSDTEVALKAYMEWGPECLHRFNGMWAFVIYDLKEGRFFGARDRFGIKPFFYHHTGAHFSFASEIKALLTLPWIDPEVSLPAVKDYLFYSRVDTSHISFFKDIFSLKSGHFFVFDTHEGNKLRIEKWWDLRDSIENSDYAGDDPFEAFRELLLSSVRLRLRSDVPVGTCLSGGLDSSAIVALANPYLKEGFQRTFSIVQPGHPMDETRYMDCIIEEFKVKPQKKIIRGEDLLGDLTRFIRSHDEPFTSTSMYAQWKVFELAKGSGVTVTLDGQGADETLAGYSYFKMVYWAELLKGMRMTRFLKETSSGTGSLFRSASNLLMAFSGFFPHRRMISMAAVKDPQYRTSWIEKSFFGDVPLPHAPLEKTFDSSLNQRLYEVFAFDGLPALLRYADRNSMAHSLESRMPFMDYRLVTFLFGLRPELKIQNGWSKFILRESLKDDVPELILKRRDKVPFVTSEAQWFRSEMKDFIEDVFQSDRFISRPYLRPSKVQELFQNHLDGKMDASRPLWRNLNLELWTREYIDG